MRHPQIGVVEGFFGPAWPRASRLAWAAFLAKSGGGFYLYAPKADPFLRKRWREPWSGEYLAFLMGLAHEFQRFGVRFGVGLSPFGFTLNEKELLAEKLGLLNSVGVETLGIFFDDMPKTEDLAHNQIVCVEEVRRHFQGELVFCPSYYTPDPILDKVFGERPAGYLDEIARGIPQDVQLAWTGPQVISPTIDVAHMQETAKLLKRAPYLWENLFANDGPKNCKFLKLKPFEGREDGVAQLASAFAFNMMNQSWLSQIVFLASRLVLEKSLDPGVAFEQALSQICSAEFAQHLREHRVLYLEKGLDHIDDSTKQAHLAQLTSMKDNAAQEVAAWLKGEYVVGSECLTD